MSNSSDTSPEAASSREPAAAGTAPEADAARDDVPTSGDPADAARQRDEYYDRLLRTTAEFDNYRKRIERERRDLSDTVAADVVQDLLPVLDDLERALQVPATSDEAEAYRKGFEIIQRQLLDALRKRGVRPIDVIGADFDPLYHEAVAHEPSETHRGGEVIGELRRGYMLGDRLLRPSMVRVAKA